MAPKPEKGPVALPADEAMEVLLSPDGYYRYLSIPKPQIAAMGLKYQAAMKAGDRVDENASEIDVDRIKKNYRRLSLRHHPDKPGGDVDTFRILNRAKTVLSNQKLRREYDLVGLDLEDDEGEHQDDGSSSTGEAGESEDDEGKGKTESVMSHLASASLAAVLQVAVRTVLMGITSTLISRYTVLTYLAFGALLFVSTRIYKGLKQSLGPESKIELSAMKDVLSPILIAFGLYCMYRGRRFLISSEDETEAKVYVEWSWTFWFGEMLVMAMFMNNSVEQKSPLIVVVFMTISFIFSLIMKGRFWRYLTLLGFLAVLAMLVVLVFPIMEMVLESIVDEKMRKVGEKIRAHDARMRNIKKSSK